MTLIDPTTLAHLQSWQGRSDTLHDDISAAPLRGWMATLDRPLSDVQRGTELPPLGHWLYFLPTHAQSELGPDGHALRGGFLPPVPLPRRMWAGGRLTWVQAIKVGDAVQRRSRIASVKHKAGRSGDLIFVEVEHEVHSQAGLCLTEVHDIVYRPAPQASDPVIAPVAAPSQAAWQRAVVPDAVLLFRYSALTFNGHRIHYDRSYVTQEEGYPGLVVHGPLLATLLLDLVARHTDRPVRQFSFKALRPTFECADGRAFKVCGQPDGNRVDLWAQDHEGWLTMQASAELA